MKNRLLIVIALLGIVMTSCRKVTNNYAPEYVTNASNTITDPSQIADNSTWTLVEKPPYGPTTTKRYFKFESNGKYVLIDKQDSVDPYFWKEDKFYIGAKFSGTFIKSLM